MNVSLQFAHYVYMVANDARAMHYKIYAVSNTGAINESITVIFAGKHIHPLRTDKCGEVIACASLVLYQFVLMLVFVLTLQVAFSFGKNNTASTFS